MSTTAAPRVVAEVDQWLSRFDEALTRGDSGAAAELFGQDSYWRDLVAFTWNITTVEGQAGVRHMLEYTLARTQPRGWRVAEEPVSGAGVGEAWIAVGARRRALRVPTIIIERNARPGDSWRKRHKSLCLHDPVWYDHLPYIKFPPNWPVFSPKDKIADWLEMYVRVMELNYWSSAE